MHKESTNLLQGNISSQLMRFFWPIMFGSLFQQLYNTVDAIVVGNYVGKQALGAVGGSTGTVIYLLIGFSVGLSSGATVIVAQHFGMRDAEGVHKGIGTGMWLAVMLGLLFTAAAEVLAPWFLQLMNIPADIYPYSLLYFRIYMIGFVPSMVYNTGAGVLRAIGDSKRPLYFLIAACITNIVLDILFVCLFHWDILGVALATVFAQTVSCVLTLLVLKHSEDIYRFELRDMACDRLILKKILRIGMPTGIQSSLYSLANLVIQAGINSYGTDIVAAYTAFGKIDALFWNTSGALGTAVLTFCGQNFGAGNIERVRKGMRTAVIMYVIGAAVISLGCYTLGPFLYRLFTPEESVIREGVSILRHMCPYWAVFCFVEVYSQGMRACGDTLVPMIVTTLGVGVLRVLWILLYPAESILETLLCYPVSWTLTALMFLIYYLSGIWLKRAMRLVKTA